MTAQAQGRGKAGFDHDTDLEERVNRWVKYIGRREAQQNEASGLDEATAAALLIDLSEAFHLLAL